ncbi:WD40 repeat-like protein, partial [Rhizodiscina lignyota]
QSQANLNQIVLEYLSKKGYNKTEATLRKESAIHDQNGRPLVRRVEDQGGQKYSTAFILLRDWVEDNLDIYKPELRRLLWPVFVYSYLNLAIECYFKETERYFNSFQSLFLPDHEVDVRALTGIQLPEHVHQNATAQIYYNNRYRLSLTKMAQQALYEFLEAKESDGGSVIVQLLQRHFNLIAVDRASVGHERSLAALLARGGADEDMPMEDEGIPGHNPGSANTDPNAPPVLPNLKLGMPPMDPEAAEDVRGALQDEDAKNPPAPGQNSLVEEFDQRIKREPTEDAPTRDTVPLPPPLARDVAMEVQKIKENRDRFRIFEKTTGGLGPGVSVVMYTFHNTFDSINCLDFSGDQNLVAAGMAESYIRVWSLDGSPLPSLMPSNPNEPPPKPVSSRRLVGHSGPVYAVSFSPSTVNPSTSSSAQTNGTSTESSKYPSTKSQYLLSSSADKTIRLWSLDVWQCLVAYRAHDSPVWDVQWGPFGYYFASAGHDRTARLWATDHVEPLRMFVGHDQDVDVVAWHPNGAYVFTASGDKTVRMWDVQRGTSVRMFTGHLNNLTALAVSSDGEKLASADDSGAIVLWDLKEGARIKRMRGHGKGGVWSLSWSAESNVLVSGGADGTVRVWDCDGASSGSGAVAGVGAGVGAKKKKEKDVVVTGDQIAAFPTKKSPVYKVQFTRMNLVMAGGAFIP